MDNRHNGTNPKPIIKKEANGMAIANRPGRKLFQVRDGNGQKGPKGGSNRRSISKKMIKGRGTILVDFRGDPWFLLSRRHLSCQPNFDKSAWFWSFRFLKPKPPFSFLLQHLFKLIMCNFLCSAVPAERNLAEVLLMLLMTEEGSLKHCIV